MIPPDQNTIPVLNYFILRRAIGSAGFFLPITMMAVGYFMYGQTLQTTISDYYHTPVRDIFVGLMTCIAAFLYCYTGYDRMDNFLTNLAGLAALGIAYFPTDTSERTLNGSIHLISAGIFFLTVAIISIWKFPKTGAIPSPNTQKRKRNIAYYFLGILILVCMALIVIWKSNEHREQWAGFGVYRPIFWLESIAIWAFALSWLIKGQAILKDS